VDAGRDVLLAEGAAFDAQLLVGITVAMTAVGMTGSLTAIKAAGWRPPALGGILWMLVAASSLALQVLTGQLHTLG